MKTIKATFANGDSITTGINGSEDEIRAHYLGKHFNLGDGAGGDNLQECVSVEILQA